MPEEMINDREQIDRLVPALREEVRRVEMFVENAQVLSGSLRREFDDHDWRDGRGQKVEDAASRMEEALAVIASVIRDL